MGPPPREEAAEAQQAAAESPPTLVTVDAAATSQPPSQGAERDDGAVEAAASGQAARESSAAGPAPQAGPVSVTVAEGDPEGAAPHQRFFMLVSLVLVGLSTAGRSEYTEPPPLHRNQPDGRRFDSCHGYWGEVFAVFRRDQIYPKFLLEYTMHDVWGGWSTVCCWHWCKATALVFVAVLVLLAVTAVWLVVPW